ncbi:hypothetical protein XENOCAPTIV_000933 [Xenoophorus captivus]|uniref:Uncharacterized protein n=1 Tax=Xenoophorus captivus TaxID=1517983 RepID=A0ABV0S4W3_9TELE
MVFFWSSDCQEFIRESLGEETVFVEAGFSRQSSVAPPEGKSLNCLCAGCVRSAEMVAADMWGVCGGDVLKVHHHLQSLEWAKFQVVLTTPVDQPYRSKD